MLKQLTTKNFRKLTDHSFTFAPGLQVVRGANEAGKTTMLEAWAYLLGGIKACRSDLSELVTWGQPERSLKVEGTVEIGGVEYRGKRSKSGAEITYGKERVVGQAECTAFWERLLGTDMTTLGRLMLASQGAIRGALEGGSKPTMELIEALANFEVIDRVIALIQAHLVTGPTTTAEDRVKRAEQGVRDAQEALMPPDVEGFAAQLQAIGEEITDDQAELAIWAPRHDETKAAWQKADSAARERTALHAAIGDHRQTLVQREQEWMKAEEEAATRPAVSEDGLREWLETAKEAKNVRNLCEQVQTLMARYPESYWEGTAASLTEAIEKATRQAAELQVAWSAARAELSRLNDEASSTSTTCGQCKQALPNAAALQAHRDAAAAKAATVSLEVPQLHQGMTDAAAEREALLAVQRSALPYQQAIQVCGNLIEDDDGFVPPKLTWVAPLPTSDEDVGELERTLAGVRALNQRSDLAAATASALATLMLSMRNTLAAAEAKVLTLSLADALPRLAQEFEDAAAQYNLRRGDIEDLRLQKAKLEAELRNSEALYRQQLRGVEQAEAALKREDRDLDTLVFNNNLLKRVRVARPIIADRLWVIVLAAVSSYFSKMRGTTSVVTRAHNAFKVDGQSIEGLSGSTLDILGLAIRLALTRTFLPTATFLILDEPAAACDDNRALSMLSFLVSAGFPQTLLVTHEEMSETIANNVIELAA